MAPETLKESLRPITVVVGHYGVGKTNFALNLALDAAKAGMRPTLVDLDVVNPYFRASEQRALLEAGGVALVAPVFAESGTSLDVPSLTGRIDPALANASPEAPVIVDAGGDDVGATALGRFARHVEAHDHSVIYVLNRFRNLVQDPPDAVQNLREVEFACHLQTTALANNSHLKAETTPESIREGVRYAAEVASLSGLPLVCTAVSQEVDCGDIENLYPIHIYVRSPWE